MKDKSMDVIEEGKKKGGRNRSRENCIAQLKQKKNKVSLIQCPFRRIAIIFPLGSVTYCFTIGT